MKYAIYAKSATKRSDPRVSALIESLAPDETYDICCGQDFEPGTDMLLSVGGDGTFLSAARMACRRGIPVLGVNLGRMGFLSEYTPEEVAQALRSGDFTIEDRDMLEARVDGDDPKYAFNEISLARIGSSMIGIDVSINGEQLPTYWADGLLVATSSGSTAYSLSAGGPICTPDAKVLIITPISPHNLNIRPLIVPSSARIELSIRDSRDGDVMLTRDNAHMTVSPDVHVSVSVAHFSLKRIRLSRSNFIGALKSKFFWGEDVRNLE